MSAPTGGAGRSSLGQSGPLQGGRAGLSKHPKRPGIKSHTLRLPTCRVVKICIRSTTRLLVWTLLTFIKKAKCMLSPIEQLKTVKQYKQLATSSIPGPGTRPALLVVRARCGPGRRTQVTARGSMSLDEGRRLRRAPAGPGPGSSRRARLHSSETSEPFTRHVCLFSEKVGALGVQAPCAPASERVPGAPCPPGRPGSGSAAPSVASGRARRPRLLLW